jgi:capsular polysaccharide biosynthesis protein
MVRLPPRLRPLFPYLKPAYTHATRLLAPTTQRLSRLRGGHLPTGVVDSMEQAAVSSGGTCVVARPAELIARPAALGIPAGNPVFAATDGKLIPRVAVAELPGGRVLGDKRAIITGNGDLLQEQSWYFGTSRPREHPLFLHPFPEPPFEFDGRLGVLASRGDGNYYHFLVDVLARIGVLEQTPQIAPPDRWYVPAGAAFQRELLAMFGLGADQLIDSNEHPHVRARTLVVPGLPATDVLNPPWVTDFLRGRLVKPAHLGNVGPPIYVTRGSGANNRRVVNESGVLELLTARGFRALDPATLSVAEQIAAFAAAPVIVSPHGAALANVIFASPGSALIEFLPGAEVLPDCYWTLAHSVPGVEYRYLISAGRSSRATLASALVEDIVVDLSALERLLDDVSDRRDRVEA